MRAGRDLLRRAFEWRIQSATSRTLHIARQHLITNLLAAGDPLVDVQREAEQGLRLPESRFGLVIHIIATQLGLDPHASRFDGDIRLASTTTSSMSSSRAPFVE